MRHRIALAALAALTLTAPAAGAAENEYAPLERPGPALTVGVAALSAALECTPDVKAAARNPVLLIPGTNLDPDPNFAWNYMRAFAAQKQPYCSVTLPNHTMGDIQVAGEYVVHALRAMAEQSGRKVSVLGFSQGGMLPRWALRFWPDTREIVEDVVGLAPSNHGTDTAVGYCRFPCPPAYWQQRTGSRFGQALNSGAETFAGIDYTVAYTRNDEIVYPNLDEASSRSALRGGPGRVANVQLQSVCPANVAEHLAIGSYDPVGYAIAMDALSHPGPADQARIDRAVCSQAFHPGVDPATFAADYAAYVGAVGQASAESPTQTAEPELRCYTLAACPVTRSTPAASPVTERCSMPERLRFTVSQRRGRVTRVRVYVDRRLYKVIHGRRIRRITIPRPARRRFTVRVVASTATKRRLTASRRYRGCPPASPTV